MLTNIYDKIFSFFAAVIINKLFSIYYPLRQVNQFLIALFENISKLVHQVQFKYISKTIYYLAICFCSFKYNTNDFVSRCLLFSVIQIFH